MIKEELTWAEENQMEKIKFGWVLNEEQDIRQSLYNEQKH
jgi:hypothetical protein